jgi:hypothetical protein
MIATNPIEIAGKSFDHYSLNLAINGKYLPDGTPDASIAARFIPTRLVEDGEPEQAQEQSVNIALGSLSGADAPTLTAVAEISAALQKFIISKGF